MINTIYTLYFLEFILFILIVTITGLLYKYVIDDKAIQNTSKKMFDKAKFKYENRILVNEKRIDEIGEIEEHTFIDKVDRLIQQSKIGKISAEQYILLNILIGIIAFIISSMITQSFIISILFGAITLVGIYSYVTYKSNKNYDRIDNQALIFCNILSNYSLIYSDLGEIMRNTSLQVQYPLNEYLDEFAKELKLTGRLSECINTLNKKIGNVILQDMFSNLELSSYNTCDYCTVINRARSYFGKYMDSKITNKSNISKGKKDLLLLVALGFVCLYIMGILIPNAKSYLLTSTVGQALLLVWIVLIIRIVLDMITLSRKGD